MFGRSALTVGTRTDPPACPSFSLLRQMKGKLLCGNGGDDDDRIPKQNQTLARSRRLDAGLRPLVELGRRRQCEDMLVPASQTSPSLAYIPAPSGYHSVASSVTSPQR